MCTQQPLAHFMGFSLLKYPRERFENANICIFPHFQETVGSHLKQSLWVVMAKISCIHIVYTYRYCSLNSILMNFIERGLIHLCNLCNMVYRQIKQTKSENCFIKLDRCHKSWKLTQMLMLKSKTWRSIIATEEKCCQFKWCFWYIMVIIIHNMQMHSVG